MSRFIAAIAGLGQIGMGYDAERPRGDASVVLSHASALEAHEGFDLVAAVDQDPDKRRRFETKYAKPAYPAIEDLLLRHPVDVWAVGVPTAAHHTVCETLLAARARAILCEKPFTGNAALAAGLARKAEDAGCLLGVNYNRRFLPALAGLREDIRAGRFGEIYKGTLYYTKGIRHNGSHFIDLIRFLLGERSPGEAAGIRVIEAGREAAEGDREPDVVIGFGGASVYALAGRAERFYMGQFELLGTLGRIEFADGEPIRIRMAASNPHFPAENILQAPALLPNPAERALYHAWDGMHRALARNEPLPSTAATAAATLRTIEAILSQTKKSEGHL